MPILLALLLLFLIIIILGSGTFLYLSAKGVAKMTGLFSVSSVPRPIKRSLHESRQYGRLITRTVRQYPPGPLRDRLNLTIKPVDAWLEGLTKLEKGLNKLNSQRNLPRELRRTEFEIESLRREVQATGSKEAAYMQELMDSKKQHLRILKELRAFHTQAELKIRKIGSDLGATHAEILLLTARGDFNENRLHRLDENLQDHLAGMHDILAAMDELGYGSSSANW